MRYIDTHGHFLIAEARAIGDRGQDGNMITRDISSYRRWSLSVSSLQPRFESHFQHPAAACRGSVQQDDIQADYKETERFGGDDKIKT